MNVRKLWWSTLAVCVLSAQAARAAQPNVPFYGTHGTFFADVTGDGMADAIALTDTSVLVRPSSGDEFLAEQTWMSVPFYGDHGTFFADVDGDGRADAIAVGSNGIVVRLSTGFTFKPNAVWLGTPYYGDKGTYFVDVTGPGGVPDGKADAVVVNSFGPIVVRPSLGTRFGDPLVWTAGPFVGTKGTYFADVTGDGRADAIAVNDTGILVRPSTGFGFGPTQTWTSNGYYGVRDTFFANVNTDPDGVKRADGIVVNDATIPYGGVNVRTSSGAAPFRSDSQWSSVPYYGTRGTFFADVTGDGRADAIVVNDSGIVVRRSTGTSFSGNEEWSPGLKSDFIATALAAIVDGSNSFPWREVKLPGTVCGDGSQYRFYYYDSGSPNLIFYFEGGGACWDYDTCSGRAGALGAANPNGIAANYMTTFEPKFASPILNGADPGVPGRSRTNLVTQGWSAVYMPYCTGDVHLGNATKTYADPTGAQPPLTFHHAGYNNTLAAVAYVKAQKPNIQKLLVSGFSAGGTATSALYYFVRRQLAPTVKGYLLNDSGPIFPAPDLTSLSRPLHDKIRAAWNLDGVLAALPASFTPGDLGSINRMVSQEFPNDQLAYTGYTRDYNYSRFSYERFRTPNDKDSVLWYWNADETALVTQLSAMQNWSYFIPYSRPINNSHCSTIITFIGSHACEQMVAKTEPFWWLTSTQPYECKSAFVPMETFLRSFIEDNSRIRIVEPPNGYNEYDPGMGLVAELMLFVKVP